MQRMDTTIVHMCTLRTDKQADKQKLVKVASLI